MNDLRKKLKRIELLTHLRDRKSKELEVARDSRFYEIFGTEQCKVTDLKRISIMLQRIDIKIKNQIKQL